MLANWVKQTTSSTGTGNLTLAAVTDFPTFATQFGINQPFVYTIRDASTLKPIEQGIGKMSNSTTMVRVRILNTMVSGTFTSVGATAVSLPSGSYEVICTNAMQLGGASAIPAFHSLASIKAMLPYPYMAAANSKALTANTPLFIACRLEAGTGLSALGLVVTTLGGTSSDKIRVGVYACNPDASIGDLVCQSGDMLPNTTGQKSATIVGGTYALPPGWYYLAVMSSVGVTIRATQGGNSLIAQVTPLGMFDDSHPYSFGVANAVTSGWTSMPTNITASSLVSIGSDYAPAVYVYL